MVKFKVDKAINIGIENMVYIHYTKATVAKVFIDLFLYFSSNNF